jgi:trehalose 6-phosphate synthase/phosphatase
MALGDDRTDEDTIEAMPKGAFTIKVGLEKTNARYQVLSVEDIRKLLSDLANIS